MAARGRLSRGAAGGLTLVALASCGADGAEDLPGFADGLPGRTAVLVWREPGDALPREWTERIVDLGARLRMEPQEGDGWLALIAPDEVAVGWRSLAASRTFREALAHVPDGARTRVWIDLEQVVETAGQVPLPAPLGAFGQRAIRAFGLRALRFAVLGIAEDGGRVQAAGVLATTGVDTGLPGLLTVPVEEAGSLPPVRRPGITVDAAFSRDVLPRVAHTMLAVDERTSLFEGLVAGRLRVIARAVDHLGGRLHAHVGRGGQGVAAVEVADEAALRRELEALTAPRAGAEPPWRIDSGWLVVSDRDAPFEPPGSGEPVSAPFARVVVSGDAEGRLLLQRAADDVVRIELQAEPPR